ncbi:NAD-dependent epimerase/dehydratase family protein [Streptomyces cupreus]|uniref:NAD-dependent epimerase/dehydratase family protein n=1 Tax=Streptomyces cupreus TaxID=2759956 RepID=A0A7X1J5T7_9ACTN|nr:NAD-dependent epimerase/dehydratase family protein [Streptomyces cupreus]MBC2904725.1 NAD-dependent epimerase/dehydratase family protein [Streptomyces cupreus]
MSVERGKRIVVTGATGNVGTSVVRALSESGEVSSVVGLARRVPAWSPDKTEWVRVDVSSDEGRLAEIFSGADAVVHLAWRMQPTRDQVATWRTNVLGSVSVFQAVTEANVPVLVYASSVGAYAPGPKDRAVDETWPTHGWPTAAYCREKAYVERVLDGFEQSNPGVRVIRMRPAFMFKREAASEQRRIFGGHYLPGPLARPHLLPFVPDVPGLRFQALHTDDAARAIRIALTSEARGAFNLAAEPPLDAEVLGELFHARAVRLPATAARSGLSAAWALRLAAVPPQLFDAVVRIPLMDCTRARVELGWVPEHTATEALKEMLRGVREGSGMDTPPLVGHKAS